MRALADALFTIDLGGIIGRHPVMAELFQTISPAVQVKLLRVIEQREIERVADSIPSRWTCGSSAPPIAT